MPLPTSAANVPSAHVSPPPTCISCTSHTRCLTTVPLFWAASLVFCRDPQRPKSQLLETEGGEGWGITKTHPSGKGWGNFPRSGGRSTRFFHSALILLSHPQPPRTTWAAQDAGRWSREGGERRLPDHPEGSVRAEIPAWRKRGPVPAQGRRRRHAPSVHQPSRR